MGKRWVCDRCGFALVTIDGSLFVSSCSDTRAMGRLLDIIRNDLIVEKDKGRLHTPLMFGIGDC